ncbi:MAG: hypothetical protein M5R36_13095 [Deltaproteobacteria bacterium]|nr:hypothetical protein [Deltaproteobacteria bacterium]
MRLVVLPAALAVLVFFAVGCGCGDADSAGDDDADDDSALSDDDRDDDAADDDAASDDDVADDDDDLDDDVDDDTDDDVDDDGDDDTATDDDADDDADDDDPNPLILPPPPDDGRLYGAAAKRVITPNEANHPETIYMGGTSQNRIATGVHDDLLASVLVLANAHEHVVIASLDLIGFPRPAVRKIRERLAWHGLSPDAVFVSSTHTHEGPGHGRHLGRGLSRRRRVADL